MKIAPHVDALRSDLAAAASLGDARAAEVGAQLAEALTRSAPLRFQEALGEALLEANEQLPSGHLELRLAGSDPGIVFVDEEAAPVTGTRSAVDEPSAARLTLRLPGAAEVAARGGGGARRRLRQHLARPRPVGRGESRYASQYHAPAPRRPRHGPSQERRIHARGQLPDAGRTAAHGQDPRRAHRHRTHPGAEALVRLSAPHRRRRRRARRSSGRTSSCTATSSSSSSRTSGSGSAACRGSVPRSAARTGRAPACTPRPVTSGRAARSARRRRTSRRATSRSTASTGAWMPTRPVGTSRSSSSPATRRSTRRPAMSTSAVPTRP